MSDQLKNIRSNMEQQAAEVWDSTDEEIQAAIGSLEDVFGSDAREVFREAAFSSGSLQQNMRDAAEEYGVEEEFTSMWRSDDTLQRLKYEVKDAFQGVWAGQTDAADEIYSAFREANISELNTMCAEGNYSAVMDELGNPDNISQPSNFAECAQAVARVQEIGATLEGMYRD